MESTILQLEQGSNGTGQGGSFQERSVLTISTRRSACDRCRTRKLRCARLPGSEFFTQCGGGGSLPPCERCLKAGVDCLYTIRTRRTHPWCCGYERQVFKASATLPYIFQLPLEGTFGSGAVGQVYHESRSRWHFGPHMPASQGEGHPAITPAPRPDAGPDHGSTERGNNFQWPMTTEFSAVDLSAVYGDFASMATADHSLGIPQSFSAKQWQEYTLTMAEAIGLDSSNHKTDSGLPAVGSNILNATQIPVAALPSGTREECLRRLTELTSQLIVSFSFTEDRRPVDFEDFLAYSPRGKGRAAEVNNISETSKNMVGMLLERSQVFLDTLERLKSLERPRNGDQTSCSPSASSESDFSFIDSPALTTSSSYEASSMPYLHNGDRDNEVEMEDVSKVQEPPRHTNKQKAPVATSVLSPHLNKYFSMPTTFTIISCYMWLFRGYEAIFAAIHKALVAQNNQANEEIQESTNHLNSKGKKTETPILPDVNPGGVDLNCHPHLQIEMLIHVSCQMLQRIEAALGIDPTTSREGGGTTLQNPTTHDGVLNVSAAPALLQTFFHGYTDHKSARLSLDSGILKSILDNLRGSH
ncbi:hypothetical protein PspLS_11565 [Pyricularia sp. CBS 133598]|nr:hypothetical protein PspLS_11565 [Pyricularia sp. CBS 133598]